jgi:hypothetical protein
MKATSQLHALAILAMNTELEVFTGFKTPQHSNQK